jgi:hypothetical protein
VKLKKLAHLIALIGVVGPAMAQEAQPQQPMQRVEITASSIKRIAKEGALPVSRTAPRRPTVPMPSAAAAGGQRRGRGRSFF